MSRDLCLTRFQLNLSPSGTICALLLSSSLSTMAAPDIVTKRIHVGGLTPSITPTHIKDRFKSFGNVLQVEEMSEDGLGERLPHLQPRSSTDSSGQPRPFTFFTIQTTPPQLKKCKLMAPNCEATELIKLGLNIMSGSMWRGCQLRLAEAKPKYEVRYVSSLVEWEQWPMRFRLQKERNPTKEEVADRLRKRKRRVLTARGPDMGKEAQDMRIPDERNYKSKKVSFY